MFPTIPQSSAQQPPAPSATTTGPLSSQQSRPLFPSSIYNNGSPSPDSSSPTFRMSLHDWLSLRSEETRLTTYDTHFPSPFPLPSELAKAGFFYLGVADHVQCVFCRGVIKDWEINDDPHCEHERLFPNCPFVLGKEVKLL